LTYRSRWGIALQRAALQRCRPHGGRVALVRRPDSGMSEWPCQKVGRFAQARPAPVLNADQFGDLGGNDFHRVLRRVQPVSRAEQGADLPDLVVGRLVYDRDQLVACEKF
jgi:hypothetical protein